MVTIGDYIRHYRWKIEDYLDSTGSWIKVKKYLGYRLYFSRGTTLINHLRRTGIYEPLLSEKIAAELSAYPTPHFIDVGANIGIISLNVCALHPGAHISAFEPGPHQVELFNKTITNNHLQKRIQLHRVALGEKKGSVSFFTHSSAHVSGDGLIDTGRAGKTKKIIVPMDTLDHWWKENRRPSVEIIKIDTEGAELYVLQGASRLIASQHPIIFFEMQTVNLQVYPYQPRDILACLNKQQYSVYTLDNQLVTSRNLNSLLPRHDLYVARYRT